jgi:hypothetical protein
MQKAIAPSHQALRPLKPARTSTFPVYPDLVTKLVSATAHPDDTAAHTLAVAAGYAYADAATLAMIMARMGLADCHCLMLGQYVDAMFIDSTAFLIQSSDGQVVILAYRGTQPTNLISWLTDLDEYPDQIELRFPTASAAGYPLHAGFYRNVRATRYEVIAALERALAGRSVLDDGRAEPSTGALPNDGETGPMKALYITGHSLGGAMAAIMTTMLAVESPYQQRYADVLRAAYTFGQPMVGSPGFADECANVPLLNDAVIRYIYRDDPIPHLPPKDSDRYQHFGQEYRYGKAFPWSNTTASPIGQSGLLPTALSPLAMLAQQSPELRRIPFRANLNDHGPQHYIAALTPPGVPNEFGDDAFKPRHG